MRGSTRRTCSTLRPAVVLGEDRNYRAGDKPSGVTWLRPAVVPGEDRNMVQQRLDGQLLVGLRQAVVPGEDRNWIRTRL